MFLLVAPKDKRIYGLVALFVFSFFYAFFISTPREFPRGTTITLEKGLGLAEIAHKLEKEKIVRSEIWFRISVIVLAGEKGIQAGEYSLDSRNNTLTLAWRLTRGMHGFEEIKITVPEGFTNEEIAKLFSGRFAHFDQDVFLSEAKQGYMFPDTYFVKENVTTEEVIKLFKDNYERKVAPLIDAMKLFGKSEEEIIKMASIIEGEVVTEEDKEMVSGILWKRLSIGMALQVDADPNTYKEPGLPKQPINNPGLVSIRSAMNPKSSPYFYFLNAKEDGKTYYAETLEKHILNIKEHL